MYAEGGFFSANHQYLLSYYELAFFTKVERPLGLPRDIEVVVAKLISIAN